MSLFSVMSNRLHCGDEILGGERGGGSVGHSAGLGRVGEGVGSRLMKGKGEQGCAGGKS